MYNSVGHICWFKSADSAQICPNQSKCNFKAIPARVTITCKGDHYLQGWPDTWAQRGMWSGSGWGWSYTAPGPTHVWFAQLFEENYQWQGKWKKAVAKNAHLQRYYGSFKAFQRSSVFNHLFVQYYLYPPFNQIIFWASMRCWTYRLKEGDAATQ